MDFKEVVQKRRTVKIFTGEAIPREEVYSMLKLAITAPCHRRNEPWRFYIIEQAEMPFFYPKLLEGCEEAFAAKGAAFAQKKREGLAERLAKVGAIVYVTSQKNENALIEKENYAAVSCAIQNLMLAAYDRGWGSFWCTGYVFALDRSLRLVGANPEKETFAGAIWLGRAACEGTPPEYDLDSTIQYWKSSV